MKTGFEMTVTARGEMVTRTLQTLCFALIGCALFSILAVSSGCSTIGNAEQQVVPAVAEGSRASDIVTQASAVSRSHDVNASRHITAALEAYHAGDIERALRETQRAQRADPDLSTAWELEAMFSADAGDPDRQAKALLSVVAAHPDSPQILHTAGQLLVHTTHQEVGLAALHRAVESAPGNTDYVRNLAGIYVELAQTRQAIAVLRDGLSRNPTDRTLPISLARLYESTGDWNSALRFYTVSLQNEPGHAGWRRQRARCLYQLGNHAEAAYEFQRCLEIDVVSLTQTDRIEFGDACLQTGDLDRAAWLFNELSREGLATRDVEILRGVCALRQGQTNDAEQIFTEALQRWPGDVSLTLLLENCRN